MSVRIRLQRLGTNNTPYYRVVVTDSRNKRDGRFVENVGTYDPANKSRDKQFQLKLERVEYWLSVGAQPSETVHTLIKKARRKAEQEAPKETAAAEPAPAAVAETAPAEASPSSETDVLTAALGIPEA